jgi:hypothetical protein
MDPNREYAYDGENAWQLYHLFVNELGSKIENNYLKINDMSFRVKSDENIEVTNKRYSKSVSYFCDENGQSLATFFYKNSICKWQTTTYTRSCTFRSPNEWILLFPIK